MSKMPKKAKARLERPVKDDVKDILTEYGWFWFMPIGGLYSKAGISDILAMKAGMFMAVEAKNKSVLTENQRGFLNSIRAEKGFAFVVNTERVEHFRAFVGALDRSIKAKIKEKQVDPADGSIMLNSIRELTSDL